MALIQLGDVPAWVSSATALYLGLRGQRRTQALDWAQTLQELAGLDSLELRRKVEANPVVAEIVGLAWETAAETASVDKRRLLARVAANALRGGAQGEVDAQQLLLRTLTALDTMHITLLVIIGQLEDSDAQANSPEQRRAAQHEVAARWASASDLMDPALATLEREGLVYSVPLTVGEVTGATMTLYGQRGWKLRSYGRRFLDHLLVDDGGWPPAQLKD